MEIRKEEVVDLKISEDLVRARQLVRSWAVEIGFSLVDQTKIVTAASELGRNAVEYGGGGIMRLRWLLNNGRNGLSLDFIDNGPGIENLERALTDGYTSRNGLGLGLSGSRRLMNDFEIESAPGKGTRVSVARWRP